MRWRAGRLVAVPISLALGFVFPTAGDAAPTVSSRTAGRSGTALPCLVARNPGCEQWTARYDHPGPELQIWDIDLSPDGERVYIAGAIWTSNLDTDYATIAYDADSGTQLWVATYGGPPGASQDSAHALTVDPNGARVYVTGAALGAGTGYDFTTVSYDATTGGALWVAPYNGTANGRDNGEGLAVSPEGSSVYVTGESWGGDVGAGGTHWDYSTVAYNADTGAERWVARYNGAANGGDIPKAPSPMSVSPDGSRVYVTGESWGGAPTDTPPGSYTDYATVAYDTDTGAEEWVARYNGPVGNKIDNPRWLLVDPNAPRVYVTGESGGDGPPVPGEFANMDYATVAYDATTGNQLWAARYQGPGNGGDSAWSLAMAPLGGRLYVTGRSDSGPPQSTSAAPDDYATLAYDSATGEELWVSRYDDHTIGSDLGWSVAASPDGAEVYVTGRSEAVDNNGLRPNADYATVAYDGVNGEELWVARYDGLQHSWDHGHWLAVHPDGAHVYATGFSFGGATNYDFATVSYLDGDELSADLGVMKADAPDPATVGRNLTYTVTVANNGPDPASGVMARDKLPPAVTFVSATPSQGACSQSSDTVTCALGAIDAGADATVEIVVKPNSAGTITNTVSVTTSTPDPASANNADSEDTTVCRRTSRRMSIPCR